MTYKRAILFVGIYLLHCGCTSNRSASLDTGFGSSGKVTTDFNSAEDIAYAVAIQADGKILVAGKALIAGVTSDFALARYDSSGNLDTTFGGDGKVTTDFGGNDEIRSLALTSDGKILAVGTTTSGTTSLLAMARYLSTGDLDPTLDSDGKFSDQIGTSTEGYAAVIQSDGDIVVGGAAKTGSSFDFLVARYTSTGVPDTTFSDDGRTTTSFGSGDDKVYTLRLDPVGNVVVAGKARVATTDDFAMARFDTNGDLDVIFSTGRISTDIITTPTSSVDSAESFVLLADGQIVLAGTTNDGTSDRVAVTRYSSTGAIDGNFQTAGRGLYNYAPVNSTATTFAALGHGLLQALDGQFYIVGQVTADSAIDFSILGLQTDGSINRGFGTDGFLKVDFAGKSDEGTALAVQTDGKLVAAGRAFNGSDYDFAVIRVNR